MNSLWVLDLTKDDCTYARDPLLTEIGLRLITKLTTGVLLGFYDHKGNIATWIILDF